MPRLGYTMPAVLVAPTLAQQIDWNQVIFWVVVLVGFAIAAAVVLVVIRKSLLSDSSPSAPVGFGLRELEAMRDRGELTEEEYQRARTRMVARLTGEDAAEPAEPADDAPMEVVPDDEDGSDPPEDGNGRDGDTEPDNPPR
ncbi:MAG: SHOCT domain-containing protein [Planctomycetota bacterium]